MKPLLTALIVDDEALARALLRRYLKDHPDIAVVGESANGETALADLERLKPDLVFLDVQMPRLSGFEVLERAQRRCGVIFTTAYDRFALQAFERHAIDYLLKPFSPQRLAEALSHARERLGLALPESLLSAGEARSARILVRERGETVVVAASDIDCVEAQDDYIAIHAAGKVHLKTQSLNELEAELDPALFVRVHRSWLIRLDRLQAIERQGRDALVARLANGDTVPVSRSGHARLKEAMGGSR